MKFFIDTANLDEIRELAMTGLLDGVTTNPTLVAKSGRNMLEVIKEICDVVPGDVSAEVTATDYQSMVREGQRLAKIAKNVVIKVPLTMEGLKACKTFRQDGIKVNAVCPGWVATDMGGAGGRPLREGGESVVWAATIPKNGPTGGFFRDGEPLPW